VSARPSDNRWHILGAGSIGCLFAAALARGGTAVTLLLRDEAAYTQLQRRGGITLEQDGRSDTIAAAATSTDALDTPIARLLICTKAQQTAAALDAIAPHLSADATLLLLQNGMGVRERLQPRWPRATWLQGLSTEGAYQPQRFHVLHAGRGETAIGAFEPAQQAIAEQLVQAWRNSGLQLRAVADIHRRQWLKLAVNSVINPLTAIHRCRNGELLRLADIDRQVKALCAELAAVACADGEPLSADELARSTFAVMHSTAANRSSMLQDIERGQETEIDFINGYVVKRGEALGVACPAHRALWERVRALPSPLFVPSPPTPLP
jgi:2-dehydropantoate 2-reductase